MAMVSSILCLVLSLPSLLALSFLQPNASINSTWPIWPGPNDFIISQQSYLPSYQIAAGFLQNCSGCENRSYFFSVFLLGLGPDDDYHTVLWRANRDFPVSKDATLSFGADGNLVLLSGAGKEVWSSNTSGLGIVSMELQNSGNLVLLDGAGKILWQSFDQTTNVLLQNQSLKQGRKLVADISATDRSQGYFYLQVESRAIVMYAQAPVAPQPYLFWNSSREIAYLQFNNCSLGIYDEEGIPIASTGSLRPACQFSELQILRIHSSGALNVGFTGIHSFVEMPLNKRLSSDNMNGTNDSNTVPGICGKYGIFRRGECICPDFSTSQAYFKPIDATDPKRGCLPAQPLICSSEYVSSDYQFVEGGGYDYLPLQYIHGDTELSIDECKQSCLSDCTCAAAFLHQYENQSTTCFHVTELYTFTNKPLPHKGPENTPHKGPEYTSSAFLKVRHPPSETEPSNHTRHTKLVVVAVVAVAIFLSFIATVSITLVMFHWKRKLHQHWNNATEDDHSLSSVAGLPRRFTVSELRVATKGFSKRIGSGGFGSVFEGVLPDGSKIAVKRLEAAKQGHKEFRAEVIAIGNMQHKNLVRLRGFCSEKPWYLLVYEYMPNGSLDKWLSNNRCLDWTTRFNIALDISRGLAHLHEGCRTQVLHLDIKPQNILLDEDFHAKISDFGLSRMADEGDLSHVVTMIRGTPGYMAPEWLQLRITDKVDVYSFGVVILEIATGLKSLHVRQSRESSERLLATWVFQKARDGHILEVADNRLLQMTCEKSQLERLIRVGLWCIQAHPSARPSMGTVVKMLEGTLEVLDPPLIPAPSDDCNKELDMNLSLSVITEMILQQRRRANTGLMARYRTIFRG